MSIRAQLANRSRLLLILIIIGCSLIAVVSIVKLLNLHQHQHPMVETPTQVRNTINYKDEKITNRGSLDCTGHQQVPKMLPLILV